MNWKSKILKAGLAALLFPCGFAAAFAGTPDRGGMAKDSADSGKARIVLQVEAPWGDGSGYHLLLDPTATMYEDYYIYGVSSHLSEIYDAATLRMPENADMTYEHFVAENSSDTLLVEPGTYDMLILNVKPGSPVYAGEGYSNVNDIEFTAGLTYLFTVRLADNGSTHTTLYNPPAEMELLRLLLPATGCGLDSLQAGIAFRNNGAGYPAGLQVGYTIEGSVDTVRETLDFAIEAGQDTVYYFNRKTALSENALSVVRAWIEPVLGESLVSNNTASSVVMRHEPVSLPHAFDAASEMVPADVNAYQTEEEAIYALTQQVPLVSVCFEMEAGTSYRLSYEFLAGSEMLEGVPSTYYVLFGNASLPLEDWAIAKADSSAYAIEFAPGETLFSPEETGTYAFCFLPGEYSLGMAFRNIRIDPLAETDLRISRFVTDLPVSLPESQVENRSFNASVTVSNRGFSDADSAMVSILSNEEVLYAFPVDLPYGSEETLAFKVPLKPLSIGTVLLEARIDPKNGQDEQSGDNFLLDTLAITDSLMVYDRMPDNPDHYWDYFSIGSDSEIEFGLPFALTAPDTLTRVSIGWTKEEDKEISINIYPWNDSLQSLGTAVGSLSTRKGTSRGQTEYALEPVILDSGSYMITVKMQGFGLAADRMGGGVLYVTSMSPILKQTDLGFPSIRAIFGRVRPEAGNETEALASGLRLYPNPASTHIRILSSRSDMEQVCLYTVQGMLVRDSGPIRAKAFECSLSGLEPGLYFARVRTLAGLETLKFIVR